MRPCAANLYRDGQDGFRPSWSRGVIVQTAGDIAAALAKHLEEARRIRSTSQAYLDGVATTYADMDNEAAVVATLLASQRTAAQILDIHEEFMAAALSLLVLLAKRSDMVADLMRLIADGRE
jgi:hypothetical protein